MSRRLLLPLLVSLVACLGAECSGSSSGSAASANSSTAAAKIGASAEAPVPEPSAALVFGVGMLVAGAVARRRR